MRQHYLILFAMIFLLTSSKKFDATFLTDALTQGAKCLDGTPGLYYLRTGKSSSKWYIHHQGGGWCESVENCYERSTGRLGSTKDDPDDMVNDSGYFSEDPSVNPQMYDWNSVLIRYCDGGSFSGNNRTVTKFKGHDLYFRGKVILDAVVESLMEKGLSSATDVVVSGCSAGGLATFLHVDYWKERLVASSPHVKVRGMPDSGWFSDYENPVKKYATSLRWVFDQNNSTEGVNQDCIAAHTATNTQSDCIFAEHTAPFIRTPIFPLQSRFDSWQTANDLHSTDAALINEYGTNLTRSVHQNLLSNPVHGIFLDSCHHHCGAWGKITIDGKNQAEAFQEWYEQNLFGRVFFQDKKYPCDECCNNK